MDEPLRFQRISSSVSITFWDRLKFLKINEYRLDQSPVPLVGFYSAPASSSISAGISLDHSSFGYVNGGAGENELISCGEIHNVNTIDEFKSIDWKGKVESAALKLKNDIFSGKAIHDTSLLARFSLTTFADLKAHKFHYWFCFPAFKSLKATLKSPIRHLVDVFSEREHALLFEKISQLKVSSPNKFGFFVIQKTDDQIELLSLASYANATHNDNSEYLFCFFDTCSLEKHPGWMLRNYLFLINQKFGRNLVKVVCIRSHSKASQLPSLVMDIALHIDVESSPESSVERNFEAVGLEPHMSGKLCPRMLDLSAQMDPLRLAESSVDLNIRLMRWRLLTSLNIELISNLRCLIIGAGTLGCNVALTLQGWGVKNIDFVDNGKVSFSNPVRQPLYDFEDSKIGKFKAIAASERLKKIFPMMNSSGFVFSIPMPGHPIAEKEEGELLDSVHQLRDLIENHDVIFLLTDSRESRWLPTLLCAAQDKLLINAALGFDSFLVLRHGGFADSVKSLRNRAACYFCSDVVAPTDSLRDRSLDQQCTVTRPGLAPIASAISVELLMSVLHHPLGHHAPPEGPRAVDEIIDREFGIVPGQIRGFITHYQNLVLEGRAYELCTACSPKIVSSYLENPNDFIISAVNSPKFLEECSGLSKLKAEIEDKDLEIDMDDFTIVD